MSEAKDTEVRGVIVHERLIPVPTSISDEAQTMLRAAVRNDGTPLNALYPSPAPDDHDGWRQMQRAADAQYAEAVRGLAGETESEIETHHFGSATVHVATPRVLRHEACVCIDLHGGALVFGGGEACRQSARIQADRHGMVCFGVDYRMPPDHPYPDALEDCMAVYRRALEAYDADHVFLIGRSAGGNLAMATILRARDEGLALPAAVILLSPEVDLTESGDSFQTNRIIDVVLPNSLMSCNLLYAGGADLTHPYVSPLFGKMTGDMPPMFLQSGTRDLFLSNAVRLHRKLRRAGVPAELHVFEAMPHGGFGGAASEDLELVQEMVRFIKAHVPEREV